MGKKSAQRVRVKQVPQKPFVNPLADLAIPPDEMISLPPKPDSNISHPWPCEFYIPKLRTSCYRL